MDCSIVVAAYAECALSEHLALSESGLCAVSVEDVEEHLVLSLARNDHHVVEVLCAGADERDAAYVDLLDDVGLRSAACYGLLERIEVNDNEVDFRDGVFSICWRSPSLSRRARMPPKMRGCRVLTRPPRIDG